MTRQDRRDVIRKDPGQNRRCQGKKAGTTIGERDKGGRGGIQDKRGIRKAWEASRIGREGFSIREKGFRIIE